MPAIGTPAAFGRHDYSAVLLEALRREAVLLASGVRIIPTDGQVVHVPRVLSDASASFVAAGDELPTSAPQGDQLVLTPHKAGVVTPLAREAVEDSSTDELDVLGAALIRGVATKIDAVAFSNLAATAVQPAGLRHSSFALPTANANDAIAVDDLVRGAGTIREAGGRPAIAWLSAQDMTTLSLEKESTGSNRNLLEPDATRAGAIYAGGLLMVPTPLPEGTAIVADPTQVVVALRRVIDLEVSSEARFSSDSYLARCTSRLDWGINDPDGLIVITAS